MITSNYITIVVVIVVGITFWIISEFIVFRLIKLLLIKIGKYREEKIFSSISLGISITISLIITYILLYVLASFNKETTQILQKFFISSLIILSIWIVSRLFGEYLLSSFISNIADLDLIREERMVGFPHVSIISNAFTAVLVIIGMSLILAVWGVSLIPILTTLGAGGIAIAIALQDTLSNFFAGIQILYSKQVRLGDYIKLSSGEKGYVVDINWRSTTLKELPNNLIIIPNSKLLNNIITNYYLPEEESTVIVPVDGEKGYVVDINWRSTTLKELPNNLII
ncbi:MAG: mechanosensitive ion channel family protein, partial [Brevinematia bacterium]